MFQKRFLLSAFSLLAATLGVAQVAPASKKPSVSSPAGTAPTTTNERINALTTNMVQALSLTPAQAEKVRAINTSSVRKVEAARQHYADDPAKLRGYIDDIGLARLEQLKDVLTPAQFARYQQKREEKLGIPTVRGYQGTPPPGMGGGRGEE